MQTYTGGCHCGAVRFEVSTELESVVSCNCSHCFRRGLLLTFVGNEQFRPLSGDDTLVEYRFNRKVIAHLFCPTCGIEAFARGVRPSDGMPLVAVNVRCLDGVDLDALEIKQVDGKSL